MAGLALAVLVTVAIFGVFKAYRIPSANMAFEIPAEAAAKCGSFPGATHVSRVQSVEGESIRVRGDFREQSCDSSVWGPLPKDRLVAKVVFRYWPLDRLGRP